MNVDDFIANNEFMLNLFKNIHPNTITIFGLLSNFYIIKNLYYGNKIIANRFLIARCLADIMDGAVARKFNKTSKIGGYLDTLDDAILGSFYIGYFIWKLFGNIKYGLLGCMLAFCTCIIYMTNKNSLSDHSNIKNKTNNIFDTIVKFMVNNSIYTFICLYFINLYLL